MTQAPELRRPDRAGTVTLKRALVGRPRASDEADRTLLSKTLALPVFASDPLSSVAYATEAALAVLVAASLTAASYARRRDVGHTRLNGAPRAQRPTGTSVEADIREVRIWSLDRQIREAHTCT